MKINFTSTIYLESLTLLLQEKKSIKEYVRFQMKQSEYEQNQIAKELPKEFLYEFWNEYSIEELMEYISVDENEITFNPERLTIPSAISFNVPCEFDAKRWMKDCDKKEEVDEEIKKLFPDWGSVKKGDWSKYGRIINAAGCDKVEIGLYREPEGSEYDGTLTLQVFVNDDVVVCEQVSSDRKVIQ